MLATKHLELTIDNYKTSIVSTIRNAVEINYNCNKLSLSLVYTCALPGLDSIWIPIHLIDMGWATQVGIQVGTVHRRSESGSNPG